MTKCQNHKQQIKICALIGFISDLYLSSLFYLSEMKLKRLNIIEFGLRRIARQSFVKLLNGYTVGINNCT